MMKVSGNYFIFQCFFSSSLCLDILALFTLTNCEKEFECSNALVNENRMVLHHSTKKYSEDIHLCTLDVQNNHEKLLHIILNLTEKNSSFTLDCRNNTKMNFNYDNQILIFTYMSFELTRIASSIILLDDTFVLASVTDQFMYPAYYFDHQLAIYSYESIYFYKYICKFTSFTLPKKTTFFFSLTVLKQKVIKKTERNEFND